MAMRLTVTYTPYATSSKEQTGDVITFAQFEEGNLLTENRYDTESGDETNSESIMISEQTNCQKRVLRHLFGYSTALKIISCVRTQY